MATTEVLLKTADVLDLLQVKRTRLHQLVKTGAFPQPIRLGPKSPRWRQRDIDAWLNAGGAGGEAA